MQQPICDPCPQIASAVQIGLAARLHLEEHFNDHVVGEAIAVRYPTIQRSR